MTFFSILCVLILEQIQASPADRIEAALTAYANFLERQFNGGESLHGAIAWGAGVLLPALAVLALQIILAYLNPLLVFVLDVVVLYFTIGYRQFSHDFTAIQLSLRMDETDRARQLLAAWRGGDTAQLGVSEIAGLTIEQGILATHRHVFGPLFWFMLLGPFGAVLYRLSLGMAQRWHAALASDEDGGAFGKFSGAAYQVVDWVPVRLSAVTFAVVGDFEDAVYCWRTQSAAWAQSYDAASGILLASGAGALGIRLGLAIDKATGVAMPPELGLGEDADVEHLQSAIGLIWRALLLCLLLLALLTVANWLG
jgi:adenosylcobinamide-phosphate synthase